MKSTCIWIRLRRAAGMGVLMLALLSARPVLARDAAAAPGHAILRRIQSPLDLARPCMPHRWVVPVTLSGDMAERMRKTVASHGLSEPRYEEHMERAAFSLILANPEYTLDTREMVSGILNPPEMIDLIIRSVIRYHDPDTFAKLSEQTDIAVEPLEGYSPQRLSVTLTPRGKRFAYSYEDLGSHVYESWLVGLRIVMDTADGLIHEMEQQKRIRRHSMHQTEPPTVEEVLVLYRFSYDSSTGFIMPDRLTLSLNGTPAAAVTAGYRIQKRHVVFDTRTVCHHRPEGDACLKMAYGEYRFEKPPAAPSDAPRKQTADIARAAEASRKATEQLREGRIRAAFRTLQRLVDDYPRTPQALEARRILSDLPKGL